MGFDPQNPKSFLPPTPAPVYPLARPVREGRALLIAGIAVGLLIVGGLGITFWISQRNKALAERESVSVEEKHRQTRNAFVSVNLNSSSPAVSQITAALDRFNAAVSNPGTASPASVFDSQRLNEELDRMGAFSKIPSGQVGGVKAGITQGVDSKLLNNLQGAAWNRHKVRKVLLSGGGEEAVVYDQQFRGTGQYQVEMKMRYWLRKDGNQWRVWDFEDLEQGLRASASMASNLARMNISNSGVDQSVIDTLSQATRAITSAEEFIRAQKWKEAETPLKELDGCTLGNDLVALRQTLWAVVHLRQAQYQQCLSDCDSVTATGQDVPIIDYYRAEAYNALGQYEKALDSCKACEEALGADREVYYQRGVALERLNRSPEAITAFKQSLDEDPDAAGSLGELSHLLPADDKSEITRRLNASDRRAQMFHIVAPKLQRSRDLAGLQTLIDAYSPCPESANDAYLPYYHGELLILRKQYPQAETLLRSAMDSPNAAEPAVFARQYYYAATMAHDVMPAYEQAGNKQQAFKELASRLLTASNYKDLEPLVAAHQKAHPDDSLTYYYQGTLLQSKKNYSAADDAYAKAQADAAPENAAVFLRVRVNARYESGKGLSAYQDIVPKDKVFIQLAGRYYGAKNATDLAKLVAMRTADAPGDPTIPLWDASAKYLAKDYKAAVQALDQITPATPGDRYKWKDMYIRSQLRLKNIDAARTEVNRIEPGGEKNLWQVALVESVAGNTTEATKAMDALLKDDDEYDVADFYGDPDIGPALNQPAFADWCKLHPKATTRPSTNPVASN